LFHYTRRFESLAAILRDGFRPFYSPEDFSWVVGDRGLPHLSRYCLPLVCFCDIPLSRAAEHREGYGSYAIGLGKTWGLANGVCPVAYITEGTPLAEHLCRLFDEADESLTDPIRHVLAFTKPYQGPHPKAEGFTRFYDEREWRFLASSRIWPIANDDPPCPGVQEESAPLMFSTTDVRYIMVAQEDEKLSRA